MVPTSDSDRVDGPDAWDQRKLYFFQLSKHNKYKGVSDWEICKSFPVE